MNIVERYNELAEKKITGKKRIDIISREFPDIGERLKNSKDPLVRLRGIVRDAKQREGIDILNAEAENNYELEDDCIVFYVNRKDNY